MRFLLKRLEYDVEAGSEYEYMERNYSKAALSIMLDEYVWKKEKVADKIRSHQS